MDAAGTIEAVVASARRIAVVGASDDPSRPSYGIVGRLLSAGLEVVPVTPRGGSVHGIPVVASLTEVTGPIDIVDVFRRPEHTPEVVRDAAAIGAGAVWLQTGIRSEEARRIATTAGLAYVEDECLGVWVAARRRPPAAP
jgi:uncharacterized protein